MDFIDLKSQQLLIREQVEARLRAVLYPGRYVFGPEIEDELDLVDGRNPGLQSFRLPLTSAVQGTDTSRRRARRKSG